MAEPRSRPGRRTRSPPRPPPTFQLNLTNGGTNNETNVVCKVTVSGTSVSGTDHDPGDDRRPARHLQGDAEAARPPSGTQTVVATVEKVPGEKNLSNNSLSFPVTFQ